MKKILLSLSIASLILMAALPAAAVVSPADITAQVQANLGEQLDALKDKAAKAIDNRIAKLNELSGRVDQMKRISDTDKSALKASIQSVIVTLTDLKAKIAGDTDLTTLKADMQSIAKAYRVYALVLPRVRIMAAADRVNYLAENTTTLSQKLQTRISQLPAGTDTTSLQALVSNIAAKISSAQSQANAAIAEVSVLVPDNGDENLMKSNTQALQDAKAKVVSAHKDLKDAANDIRTAIKEIRDIVKPASTNP